MVTKSEKGRKEMFGRFLRDRRGNIAIMFGVAAIPMVLMTGIAIDYAHDAMIRGRMTAVADAAALAATTPAMFAEATTTAQAASTAMFEAQAALVQGAMVNYTSPNCSTTSPGVCVNVTDTNVANGKVRQVSVTATVSVQNYFGALEGAPTTQFTVTSVAYVQTAPNINFYLLLDSSPSMELPATTAGITTMVQNTGCALACHESDFKDSELTQYPGWGENDSYTYAENNGITLRIDNVRQAAEGLVTTGNQLMDQYNSSAPAGQKISYQMSAHTFSDGATKLLALQPLSDGNVSAMQTAISAIMPPLMADNGYLPVGGSYTYPTGTGAGSYTTIASIPQNATTVYNSVTSGKQTTNYYGLNNDDTGTNFNYALNTLNTFMPNPGNGTNNAGDLPQGVLLIVTDGVDDVSLYKSTSCNTSQIWSFSNSYGSFTRCEQPVNTALCSTIKARGIRIAVLYTTYYPVTSNSWYTSTVAPFISQVPTNLQNCASSPTLFAQVSTDGDITAALN